MHGNQKYKLITLEPIDMTGGVRLSTEFTVTKHAIFVLAYGAY